MAHQLRALRHPETLEEFAAGVAARVGYITVPEELNKAALATLGGRAEAHVDLASSHPLAAWARKERERAQRRRSAAKTSRRKNRRRGK